MGGIPTAAELTGGREACVEIAEGSVIWATKPVSGGGGAIGAGIA